MDKWGFMESYGGIFNGYSWIFFVVSCRSGTPSFHNHHNTYARMHGAWNMEIGNWKSRANNIYQCLSLTVKRLGSLGRSPTHSPTVQRSHAACDTQADLLTNHVRLFVLKRSTLTTS